MDYLFDKWDKLKKTLVNKHIILFVDYDGTLTPIVDSPDKAVMSDEARDLLKALSTKPRCQVGVISGRALGNLKKMVGLKDLIYVGNHGLEIDAPKIKFKTQLTPEMVSIIRNIKDKLSMKLSGINGIAVEDKFVTVSIHYRLAGRAGYLSAKKIIEETASPFIASGKIKVRAGKKVLEIIPETHWNKGEIVEWILARETRVLGTPPLPIYLGDDTSDEDAFGVLKDKGLTVFVGRKKTSKAKYYLRNPKEVLIFLREILEL